MKKILTILLIISISFSFASVVLADGASDAVNTAITKIGNGFGQGTVNGGTTPDVKTREIIGKIINYLLGIIGTIALLVFIYSGIMWMLAGGNDASIVKAENAMIWAALGLFVVFISYAIISYLIGKFTF